MTQLEQLPTTDSGHIVKRHATEWQSSLDEPTAKKIGKSVIEKPKTFSGSKYSTEISRIRVTGSPEFIETVSGMFKLFLSFEREDTRLEINLQQIKDRTQKN